MIFIFKTIWIFISLIQYICLFHLKAFENKQRTFQIPKYQISEGDKINTRRILIKGERRYMEITKLPLANNWKQTENFSNTKLPDFRRRQNRYFKSTYKRWRKVHWNYQPTIWKQLKTNRELLKQAQYFTYYEITKLPLENILK